MDGTSTPVSLAKNLMISKFTEQIMRKRLVKSQIIAYFSSSLPLRISSITTSMRKRQAIIAKICILFMLKFSKCAYDGRYKHLQDEVHTVVEIDGGLYTRALHHNGGYFLYPEPSLVG